MLATVVTHERDRFSGRGSREYISGSDRAARRGSPAWTHAPPASPGRRVDRILPAQLVEQGAIVG